MLPISRTVHSGVASGLSLILLVAILGTPLIGYAKMKHSNQEPEAESAKLARAETASDRVIARLHGTLDLQTLFDGIWTTDPVLKDGFLKPSFEALAPHVLYERKLAEQLAVSTLNALYLLLQYETDHQDRPAELQELLNLLDASESRGRSPQMSGAAAIAEAKRAIYEGNRAAEYLRRHMTPGHFSSELYNRIAEQDKAQGKRYGFPKTLRGDRSLGIGEDTPIYVTYRDGFCLKFVEEAGEYRLVDFHLQLMSMGYL
jgi:hypothetical protein